MPQGDILSRFQNFDELLRMSLRAGVYLLGAAVLTVLVSYTLRRFRNYSMQLARERASSAEIVEFEKQSRTIVTLAKRVIYSVIWILGIALALKQFEFDIGPLLAGAGVAGIAIGFAAQSLLKDWINGFFLLTEGQIRINDVIRIGEFSGAVEKMTLRTISLRDFDGSLHVISNGSITSFSNRTLQFSYAVFDINVDYTDDPRRMMDLMLEVDQDLRSDPVLGPSIQEPLEIAGVDKFLEAGVTVRARIKTLPGHQWIVRREFNRRLKERCDDAGLMIATARRSMHVEKKP